MLRTDLRGGRTSWLHRIAPALCGAFVALPVLLVRYPPMGDLPLHESVVALLRHFGDAAMFPRGVYARSFGAPNQLFPFLACALAWVVPTDLACKLVVAGAIAATPLAAARLARHLGATPWCALLVAPLALGFAFRWGLVGNVVGLPVALALLPTLDSFAARPALRGALACSAGVILTYMAHESAMVMCALAAAVFALREPLDARRLAARAVPVAVGAGLATFYAWWGRHLKAPSILAVKDAFGPVAARAWEIPRVIFGAGVGGEAYVAFGLYALAVGAFAVLRLGADAGTEAGACTGAGAGRARPQRGPLAFVERHRFALVAAVWLALYFAFPLAYGGSTLLYQRFLTPALALLIVVIAPPAGVALRPIAYVLALAVPVGALSLVLPAFGAADRRFRELDDVLPLIARNSAVAQLDLSPRPPSAVAPVPGAAARALAERGGRLLFSFTDAPTSPVVVRPAHQWNEAVLRLTWDPTSFVPGYDFTRFRYALVRLAPESSALAPILVAIMAPEGRLVGASGEWLLFESTIPVVSLESPDGSLPARPPPSLRQRLEGGDRGR
jgi:hypothetical protein